MSMLIWRLSLGKKKDWSVTGKTNRLNTFLTFALARHGHTPSATTVERVLIGRGERRHGRGGGSGGHHQRCRPSTSHVRHHGGQIVGRRLAIVGRLEAFHRYVRVLGGNGHVPISGEQSWTACAASRATCRRWAVLTIGQSAHFHVHLAVIAGLVASKFIVLIAPSTATATTAAGGGHRVHCTGGMSTQQAVNAARTLHVLALLAGIVSPTVTIVPEKAWTTAIQEVHGNNTASSSSSSRSRHTRTHANTYKRNKQTNSNQLNILWKAKAKAKQVVAREDNGTSQLIPAFPSIPYRSSESESFHCFNELLD